MAVRRRAAIGAVAALGATCAVGWSFVQPPMPGLGWIGAEAGAPDMAGLAAVAGMGLLAWHLARLTVSPTARPLEAAAIASLIAMTSLPGLGVAALIVPSLLSICDGWRRKNQRVVALLVQCGAIVAALSGPTEPFLYGFAGAMMLAATGFALCKPASGAANDNPQMERAGPDSGVPISMCYVIGDSQPGSG